VKRLAAYGEPVVEGTPFGRYRLIELLGRGGMGEVWRAHDTSTNRTVAIKLLPPHLAQDDTFVKRFRREAEAAARLNSPHIIPIHDYGEIDGRLYVDMRLIEGRDLASVLAEGPLEPARAVRIIEGVAKALRAAHEVGLLHRDVKPSNVLLDCDDFAYLIDFGIARAADETRMTKSGYAIGTFQYIAPERLGTRAGEDARADVYSLACVLYECLNGRPPFDGDTMAGLVAAHLNTPPPQPSATQPNVPAQFDAVIAKGMAKDPDNRYATTVELADAARAAITKHVSVSVDTSPAAVEPTLVGDRQPTQLASAIPYPPPQLRPPRELNRPLPKRRRILAIGAAAVVVVAMATVVAYLVMARTSESSRQRASPSSQQVATPSSQKVAAPPAGAQPPFRLSDYVTDNAGVLSDSGRAAVTSATDRLYADRQIRLWVVYVDNFAGASAVNWAKSTYSTSDLGDNDALLAVSSTGRAYAFLVPSTVRSISPSQVDNLMHNQIEPALRKGDWSGAAVAAADGLDSVAG
jgi:serine/threonine protein kinase